MTAAGRTRRKLRLLLWAIAAGVVLVDQATKQIALAVLEPQVPVPVIGDLAGFTLIFNDGAALGMGSGFTWVFTLIAVIAFCAVAWVGRKLGSRTWAWALGLLLGGLTGNLIDRLVRPPAVFHGAVVDFIDLYFFICNVADIAITGAACFIIITQIRGVSLDGTRESERAGSAEESVENPPRPAEIPPQSADHDRQEKETP
ncbi:signal peptidase II [Brevibacterium sp.]|uniref:signal peptidase II n=1 Tax=Brevibacterium sp. TaxID=1701 RepID=UPI0025C29E40|nr:signal peptidase II [Brevibacterium sp.]